jgi:Cu-Zn family superoxide dismutase
MRRNFVMRMLLLSSIALAPLIVGCENTSVGVGVGGVSGNVGVGASATVGGGSARTTGSQLTVAMYKIDAKGVGPEIGTIMFSITRAGLRIEPALGGLPPGEHGFHIHEKPDCGPGEKDGKVQAGLAAGSHLDPGATGKHMGPEGPGHRGDLPRLKVDANGNATETMFVLRLGLDDLKGHAIMIHEGGDNYSDQPKPLGGGGARIACGIVP